MQPAGSFAWYKYRPQPYVWSLKSPRAMISPKFDRVWTIENIPKKGDSYSRGFYHEHFLTVNSTIFNTVVWFWVNVRKLLDITKYFFITIRFFIIFLVDKSSWFNFFYLSLDTTIFFQAIFDFKQSEIYINFMVM